MADVTRGELLDLEHEGWHALCASAGAVGPVDPEARHRDARFIVRRGLMRRFHESRARRDQEARAT